MNDMTGAEIDRLHDGRHLRAARILAGLTQQELAEAAGINVNAVRYWEAEDRSSEPWVRNPQIGRGAAAAWRRGRNPI
jgi:transcriptional regulator with XRE-family HTH domain